MSKPDSPSNACESVDVGGQDAPRLLPFWPDYHFGWQIFDIYLLIVLTDVDRSGMIQNI